MGSLPSTEAPRVASRASVCGAFGAKARMADDERTPGVTPSDAFVAQQRDVEAAMSPRVRLMPEKTRAV